MRIKEQETRLNLHEHDDDDDDYDDVFRRFPQPLRANTGTGYNRFTSHNFQLISHDSLDDTRAANGINRDAGVVLMESRHAR